VNARENISNQSRNLSQLTRDNNRVLNRHGNARRVSNLNSDILA
jgi:carbamate kinase